MPTKPPVIRPEEYYPDLDRIKWIFDPPPIEILRDSARFREYIRSAAELHTREIDLQVQTLNLEKERIQTLLKFY